MKKNLQAAVGETFRAYRESLGVSQESLAESLKMHRTYYSAIERGEKNITLATLQRVSKALSVELSVLFTAIQVSK